MEKVLKDVEILQTDTTDTNSTTKTKFMKREILQVLEDDSEQSEVPSAKRSCQRRKKETIDACNDIHGGTSEDKGPTLDGIWLALVNDSTPARLGNYVSKSKKTMGKVLPKVIKKTLKIVSV